MADHSARIVAPARWITPDIADRFTRLMAANDIDAVADEQVFQQFHQLAGDDRTRADALRAALADPECDIIWCARGGYGAARTLPLLDGCTVSHPKVLVGYSDMTALQLAGLMAGVQFVHGPMPNDMTRDGGEARLADTAGFVTSVRTGRLPEGRYSLGGVANGAADAPVITGNLSMIRTLLGTPFEPQWGRVILCVEDCTEYLYALDRTFVQIAQSRLGPAIVGLVLGDFTELEDNEVPWGETVADMARRHFPGIPVASGLPVGHGERNVPMLQGREGRLSVEGAAGELILAGQEGGA